MSRAAFVVALWALLSTHTHAASVLKLASTDAFDAFREQNAGFALLVYAPWCGHSRALLPEFDSAAASSSTPFAKVDGTEVEELATRLDIKGYPTLLFIHRGDGPPIEFDGRRDASTISRWVASKAAPLLTELKSSSDVLAFAKGKPIASRTAAAPVVEDDERTASYPKLVIPVRSPCLACARLVSNFDMGLLPRLRERHAQLKKHHSRTAFQKSATVGELESIVEAEVERICSWPNTYHNKKVRRGCDRLVEDHSDALVDAISRWAREGKYALHLGDELSAEVRPALCDEELQLCTADELTQLDKSDEEAAIQLKHANETGRSAERPLVSERPSAAKEGVLVRVVARDFHERVIKLAADADYLIYMYFPGRSSVPVAEARRDTHARLRPKYIRLAEFLDAPSSNGSLVVGWMDCVFNAIPYPHGSHVHKDTIALYPARSKSEPRYWKDLRDGDVDLDELISFVYEASANEATQRHVREREEAAGPRGLLEALPHKLLDFEESLAIDERELRPLNASRLREMVEKDEL